MDEGKLLKDRKYCSRGLEQHTRIGRAVKIQNRSSSIETVLMEQEKQSDEGTYDDVIISRVYRGVTSSCQLWANIVGVRDQRVAEDYLDDINLQMPQTITKEPEQQWKPSILRRKPRPRRKALLTSSCCVDEYDLTAKAEPSDSTEKSVSSDISSFQCAVRFSSYSEVHLILSSKHYTPEERKACWYQNEEYREIRYECVKEIKKIQRGEVLKDKKYCSRGLEAHTRVAGIIKNQNRRDAFDAVLSEQQTQIRLGVIDEGEIARKYQQIASSCQMWAHNIGLRDQLEANQSFDR